jgi:hypothetical protein
LAAIAKMSIIISDIPNHLHLMEIHFYRSQLAFPGYLGPDISRSPAEPNMIAEGVPMDLNGLNCKIGQCSSEANPRNVSALVFGNPSTGSRPAPSD